MLVFPFEQQKEEKEKIEQFDCNYSDVDGSSKFSIQTFPKASSEMNCKEKIDKTKKTRKPRVKKVDTFLPLAIERGDCWISVQLPLRTVSEANTYCHWSERAKRKSQQRSLIFATINPIRDEIKLPCTVTLKRYGPKFLDVFENLPCSFKACVDACAEILTGKGRGRGDDDPRITWRAEQEKSQHYGIKITFKF